MFLVNSMDPTCLYVPSIQPFFLSPPSFDKASITLPLSETDRCSGDLNHGVAPVAPFTHLPFKPPTV